MAATSSLSRFVPPGHQDEVESLQRDPAHYLLPVELHPGEAVELHCGPAEIRRQAEQRPWLGFEGAALFSADGRRIHTAAGLHLRTAGLDGHDSAEARYEARISTSLPHPPADEESPGLFRKRCARTLAETLRFGAARLLEIRESELRATFRLRGAAIDVILYDAVAGGAGYCVRLQQLPMSRLLAEAARRLDCLRECANACTACLCDYSNQRVWDQFDRKPVLQWLEQYLGAATPGDLGALHAVPWPAPSLSALREQVEGLKDLHLLAPSLESFAGEAAGDDEQGSEESMPPALAWLIERLNSGVRVHLHSGQDLRGKPGQQGAPLRRALRFLRPWVESGHLHLGRLPEAETLPWESLPRICSGSPTGPAWFTRQPLTPLLRALLPQPVYRAADATAAWPAIEPVLAATLWYTRADLAGSLTVNVWKLKRGEARDFNTTFAPLKNAHIERLVIHDAYCAVYPESLAQFLALVRTMAQSLDEVIIECRELSYHSPNYQTSLKIEQTMKERLTNCIGKEPGVSIAAWNKSHNDFHDRWLAFSLVNDDGLSVTRHFDLSGGIDHLMNPKFATTVYRYEPGAEQHHSTSV